MARSPLTLAASVTSALPGVQVTGVGPLSEGAAGRYDSAVADLDDGRRVVVRVPVDAEADADLRAEARALQALTAGVRGVLPFGAPDALGQTTVDGMSALVQTLLPGYRVDAAHVPAGPGVATTLAAAIASVHDLPVAVVRDAGLAVMTAAQVRDDAERLLDRAEATGHLPFGLLRRWSTALAADSLWRFETTVTLGGIDPSAFVLEDDEAGLPTVTGLLTWGGLAVGDPAVDLRWTSSAPAARDDVLDAYTQHSHRAPDRLLGQRARLHAELEFARWLVHGHAAGAESVVSDAVALLTSLEESVRDEPPLAQAVVSVDDAISLLGRLPDPRTDVGDTSMQTDAFDADTLAAFAAAELATDPDAPVDPRRMETVPIEMSDFSGSAPALPDVPDETPATGPEAEELDQAARNALRRWTGTA